MPSRLRVLVAAVGASILTAFGFGGIVWAAIPANDGISACYDTRSGQVRGIYDPADGVITACGTTENRSTAPYRAFCRARVDISVDPYAWDRSRRTAPEQIADSVEYATTKLRESGQAADEDPVFLSAVAEIDQFVLDECGFERLDVEMTDYSFDGIPAHLEKGVVAFSLRNEGAELHELQILRFKNGVAPDDVRRAYASGKDLDTLIEEVAGYGFASPGQSDVALIDFNRPGRYAAFCALPVGITPEVVAAANEETVQGDWVARHFDKGMAVQFNVK